MIASTAKPPRRIAAIVAHADDEILGCGGTLRRHVIDGDQVLIVILADGETSRDTVSSGAAALREAAALAAADLLGAKTILHSLPDNKLDSVALLDIVKLVERHIAEWKPGVIYTHHIGDVNIDHRRVHEAVVTACRPQTGHPVETLLFFETASSTEWQTSQSMPAFVPNWFVDISATIDTKMSALKAYDSEMRPWPHPRSYEGVEHLARWRGATIGCEAAEAFVLGREIKR